MYVIRTVPPEEEREPSLSSFWPTVAGTMLGGLAALAIGRAISSHDRRTITATPHSDGTVTAVVTN